MLSRASFNAAGTVELASLPLEGLVGGAGVGAGAGDGVGSGAAS